jgi:hypothetical protein
LQQAKSFEHLLVLISFRAGKELPQTKHGSGNTSVYVHRAKPEHQTLNLKLFLPYFCRTNFFNTKITHE